MVALASKRRNAKLLAYPSTCGDVYSPAWIEFTIKERKGAVIGKTKSTIGLYMPESASLPSTTSWENFQAGVLAHSLYGKINNYLANAVQSGQTYDDIASNFATSGFNSFDGESLKSAGLEGNYLSMAAKSAEAYAAKSGVNVVSSLVGSVIKGHDGSEINGDMMLGMAAGVIRNPYMTAIFRGVDFRTFEFTFKFFPHNEEECNTIYKIIEEFRMAALPSVLNTNTGVQGFFSYPLAFEIAYKWGTKDNEFINKFKPAVLTAVDISYTGNGSWTVMRNGMPSSIQLNLRFTETEIVTRGDIPRKGKNGGY